MREGESDLLPHEFTHSWNGKYRRPASLTTPDFQVPMQDDMLWVYEGMTQYLGSYVLTARSGLVDAAWSHEWLASVAATLDHRSGRTWRNLQDTATAAAILYASPSEWRDLRRGVDFYPEGVLIWLEADTIIRQTTNGQRSMDDFCHAFHGGASGAPKVVTYDFDDVVAGLNAVAPYDWRGFLRARLDALTPHAPLGGIENGGWRLVYDEHPNKVDAQKEDQSKGGRSTVFAGSHLEGGWHRHRCARWHSRRGGRDRSRDEAGGGGWPGLDAEAAQGSLGYGESRQSVAGRSAVGER